MTKKLLSVALFIAMLFATELQAQTIADFENLALPSDSMWNGSDMSGGFTSGKAYFSNTYNAQYSSWGGFAYSSKKDTLTAGFGNMYSSANGKGFNNSATYAVGFVSAYSGVAAINLLAEAKGKTVDGFYINNNTYAYQSMLNGDAYAKKFTSHDTDWFKLSTIGYLEGNITDTVDFYLADFRFADSSNAYIIKSWTWLDLTALGNVDSLVFQMSSSDNGTYGMNTPSYFCMDNFTTKNGVGFADVKQESAIRIYPNPVQNTLHIDMSSSISRIQILDVNGRLVYDYANMNSQTSINVKDFKQGLYFMQIYSEQGIITKKFIKK